jgi:predicted transglutaminase-like cysteine proteinase
VVAGFCAQQKKVPSPQGGKPLGFFFGQGKKEEAMAKSITQQRTPKILSLTIIFILFASLLSLASCNSITYAPAYTPPSTPSSPTPTTTPMPTPTPEPPTSSPTPTTTPIPTSTPAPAKEKPLLRQPYSNQTEMERYITPNDPVVKEFLQDTLNSEALAFNDFERLRNRVSSYISYQSDQDIHGVSEYWQLPSETIKLRTGDCEDFAILLCSLLRAYGVPPDQAYVAVGYEEGQTHGHAYLVEKWYQGVWRITEPQAGAWAGVFIMDWATAVSYETLYCFNDQRCIKGLPTLPPGVYEFQLGFTEGASATFERNMNSGQVITAKVEWVERHGDKPDFTIFGWGLRIYDPNGQTVFTWFGSDLSRSFSYAVPTSGKYQVEVYTGGAASVSARLTINPPDWE